jgi:DNA integrity scanning protein DisA with diadenylate cyclase activity
MEIDGAVGFEMEFDIDFSLPSGCVGTYLTRQIQHDISNQKTTLELSNTRRTFQTEMFRAIDERIKKLQGFSIGTVIGVDEKTGSADVYDGGRNFVYRNSASNGNVLAVGDIVAVTQRDLRTGRPIVQGILS